MGKVKKIFGGAKKPDTSSLERQEKLLKKQQADADRKEREQQEALLAKKKASSGRNSGRQSLLSGLETGVGAGEDKRKSLG